MSDARAAETRSLLNKPSIHSEWHSLYLNRDLDRFYDRAFARIVDKLGAKPGDTILDAGVGYGHHATRLARHDLRVVGVDLSEQALAAAAEVVRAAGVADRVELQRADLLALPFADGTFRFANCWGVLMHVPELDRALSELSRVLARGGRIAITENNAHSVHVRGIERCVRVAKRVLGRPIADRRKTEQGVEEWHPTENGALLVRKARPDFLVRQCASLGLRLVDRRAAQLTELYTSVVPRLRPAIHRLNAVWLDRVGWAGPAMGNTFVFEKR